MKNTQYVSLIIITIVLLFSCKPSSQNINEDGVDKLEKHEVKNVPTNADFQDTIYVPIYSDIYSMSKDDVFLLTATLSIRNTSMSDSIFIEAIDYYDTGGNLVRKYTDQNLLLKPLESIDYVIEENDDLGGTGANFIIIWSAKDNRLKPVFEAVMISTKGQQGISFTSQGVSISRRK